LLVAITDENKYLKMVTRREILNLLKDKTICCPMKNNRNYTLPIILVTSLFFLRGLAYGLLEALNKHFRETLNIIKQRSMLLPAAYIRAYFLIALPGVFIQKVELLSGYY